MNLYHRWICVSEQSESSCWAVSCLAVTKCFKNIRYHHTELFLTFVLVTIYTQVYLPFVCLMSLALICSLCVALLILALPGVGCLSPVLCERWVKLVVSHITSHSVHPPQSAPASRSLPSHLCNILVISSHHVAIPRKAFLCDWPIASLLKLFVSDSVVPCFALNPS